jgi:hypothetical protein
VTVETLGLALASRKKMFGEAVFWSWRLLELSPLTWSGERSSASWLSPFWTLIRWVLACTLRMTTRL